MEAKPLADHINKIYKDIKKLLELRFELLKLELVEIIVSIYSKLITLAIGGAVFTIVLLFLFIALSLYLGELWGHSYLGFLVTSGGILFLFLILLLFRRALITNPLLSTFISIFFNLHSYGQKKKIRKNK